MPSHANFTTESSSWWFPVDIMSYPFHDLYSHEPNKGERLFKILVYEFMLITKKGRMCVIMMSFSQLGLIGSKVQWNTTVCDKQDGYERPPFCRRSLLPSIFSSIFHFIRGIANGIDNLLNTIFCSHMMSTNGSPLKTINLAPTGRLSGSAQRP